MPRSGVVVAICISPTAGAPMQYVNEIQAIAGTGLAGDRYSRGEGSFNKNALGRRQVTLINAHFVEESEFTYCETRRNIVVRGIELMDQIGYEFRIDGVRFRGVKYCDPCMKPSKLRNKSISFRDVFHDRGGIIAEILEGGLIGVGSRVIPRHKDY